MAIKTKIGKCIDCGNTTPLIAKRCQFCYWKHRSKVNAKKEKEKSNSITQMDVFMEIWNESNKRSEISGRKLDIYYLKYLARDKQSMFPNCFAHIIAKGKESSLKTIKENILLVHPEEHTLLDQGTEKQRKKYEEEYNCSFDIFYKTKVELKKKYKL